MYIIIHKKRRALLTSLRLFLTSLFDSVSKDDDVIAGTHIVLGRSVVGQVRGGPVMEVNQHGCVHHGHWEHAHIFPVHNVHILFTALVVTLKNKNW